MRVLMACERRAAPASTQSLMRRRDRVVCCQLRISRGRGVQVMCGRHWQRGIGTKFESLLCSHMGGHAPCFLLARGMVAGQVGRKVKVLVVHITQDIIVKQAFIHG
jgi:hypothetical protein